MSGNNYNFIGVGGLTRPGDRVLITGKFSRTGDFTHYNKMGEINRCEVSEGEWKLMEILR